MALPALCAMQGKAAVTFVGRAPGLHYMLNCVRAGHDFEVGSWHRLFAHMKDEERFNFPKADRVVGFFTDDDGVVTKNLHAFFPKAETHLFPSLPAAGLDVHVAEYVAQCLQRAGLPVDPVETVEGARKRAILPFDQTLGKRNVVVLHPGSGDVNKNYPPEFWKEIVQTLPRPPHLRESKPEMVILVGPAERGILHHFAEGSIASLVRVQCCPGKDELLELLRRASLYVGHDSGITHLAAMTGTPTVALFRTSEVRRWEPLGPHVKVIAERGREAWIVTEIAAEARRLMTLAY
jgi:hypothetical protein